MSDENDTSQNSWKGPVEDGDEAETQLRQKQQHASRDAYVDPSARQRQRQRQPEYTYDEVNDAYMHPQQRNRYYSDPEVQEYDRRAYRPRPRTQTTHSPVRRQRRVWSTLLIGCAGGVITIALILAVI